MSAFFANYKIVLAHLFKNCKLRLLYVNKIDEKIFEQVLV